MAVSCFRSLRFAAPVASAMLLAPLLAASPARAQPFTGSPRYLPFVDDTADAMRTTSPKLSLRIGSHTTRAVMDTGSTGVVVSLYDMFPDWRTQKDLAAAIYALLPANSSTTGTIDTARLNVAAMVNMTYSSSGRIEYGVYVNRSITASGRRVNGIPRSVSSRPVPVLVVVDEECTATARHCTANHRPIGIGMLGVGYGRAHPGDTYGTRTLNPFLNLDTPTAVNGYIITASGVKIGLDNDDLGMNSTYLTVLSSDRTMKGEWLSPQAGIRLAGRTPVVGSILLDTGIDTMLITVPSATSDGLRIAVPPATTPSRTGSSAPPTSTDSTLPLCTPIAISLAGGAGLPTGYTFDTSQTTGMAPASVTLVGNNGSRPDSKATFVNTGVRLLNGFNYIFDDSHGLVGFASRAAGGF